MKTSRFISTASWFVDTVLSPTQLRLAGLIHFVSARNSIKKKWSFFLFFFPARSVLSTKYCFQANFVESDKPSCGNQFLADFWPAEFGITDVGVCSVVATALRGSVFHKEVTHSDGSLERRSKSHASPGDMKPNRSSRS